MHVLGLDPSLRNYGWSIVDPHAVGRARLVAKGTFKTGGRTFFLDRYISHRQSLCQVLRTQPVDAVGMESPVFGESYSEGLYALYIYTLEVLRMERVDVVLFSPGQLKAAARGHLGGRTMFKSDMVDWAKRTFANPDETKARMVLNNHEADASVAAWLGARFFLFFGGELAAADLNEVEMHVFTREHRITRGLRKGLLEKKGLMFRENDRFFMFSRHDLESPEVRDG